MKICFIGAGSVTFAQRIIKDILSFDNLREDLLVYLEDIDAKRLNFTKNYFDKYKRDNPEKLKNVEFKASTNQREAIKGARYIISAIQSKGLPAYKVDVEIPYKYGVRQVVGDTLGPGGVFRFLRTAHDFDSIIKDIDEVGEHGNNGSKPLFLNYTNPMAMNTLYTNLKSPDMMVGLCHGVQGTATKLRGYIGAMPNEFDYLCAGINHMGWFIKLHFKDYIDDPNCKGPWEDAYPRIWENYNEEPEMVGSEKVRWDMFKATGYFMTESSGHLAEYLPYYLKRKELIEKYRDISSGFDSLEQAHYYNSNVERLEQYFEELEQIESSPDLAFLETAGEEYCSHIINAIETGVPYVFNGNVVNKNGGLITNLPPDCCVEVPTTADHLGLHPQGGIELPPVCAALCSTNIHVQLNAVHGALEKDKEKIYHAVLLDPNTASVCSPEEIREMVDEMFKAQEQWLPKYK